MRKRRGLWVAALVTTLTVMAAIFCFSAQNAEESSGISRGLAKTLLELFPGLNNVVTLSRLNHYLRKLAHFTLYFLLGGGLTGVASKQKKVSPALIAIPAGALFAVTDEIHQFFSAGRGPMVQDVLLDTCGVITGSLFCMLLRYFLRRKRRGWGKGKADCRI